jgi:tetratricopeptide (TPR) repeat protein
VSLDYNEDDVSGESGERVMKPTTLQQAEEYLQRGRLKQAARVLRRAVQAGNAPLECYMRLAEVCRLQENWRGAIDAIRAALQRQPDSIPARERLIELLLESGRLAEAIAECERWLQEMPEHPTPLEHLLDAHWQAMDYLRALQAANRLVQLQPCNAHYRMRRARLLDNLGRREEAVSDYEWLAFEASAPLEITVWATLELQRLDRLQIHQLMRLLMEDALFWVKFVRDPKGAARERGFTFSRVGEEVLETLPETLLREIPRPPRRYAGYS